MICSKVVKCSIFKLHIPCQYLQLSNRLKYCDMLMIYKMQRVRQDQFGGNWHGRGVGGLSLAIKNAGVGAVRADVGPKQSPDPWVYRGLVD